MEYHLKTGRRARLRFLRVLGDWQLRSVAIILGPVRIASTLSHQQDPLYNRPMLPQRTNSWYLRLSKCSLLL